MIWTRPWALGFLAFAPLLAALWVATFRWKKTTLGRWGTPEVIRRLADPLCGRRQRVKAVFTVLASVFIALALAGPRWGRHYQEVRRRGVDVMVAVDVSASMGAEDIKPNRLTQAKRELGRLVAGLEGDRVGLVAFAGTAVLQCPLTLDYGAAQSLLDLIGPGLVPRPGTSLADAILTAVEAFPPGSRKHRALVLLTDGEDHSGRLDAAVKKAAEEGVRIFPIGFGNPEGEVIPVRGEDGNLVEYKKDKEGRTVTSRMDEKALASLAEATGGRFFRASQGEVEVMHLLDEINAMEKKSLESRVWGTTEDRYLWPLALALFFLLLEFLLPERRTFVRLSTKTGGGGRPIVLAIFLVGISSSGWGMGRGPFASRLARAAERRPGDPVAQFNLGHALHRDKNFAGAAEAFSRAETLSQDPGRKADAAYNAGNALFQQKKLSEAVEKYKEALRLRSSDPDAKHNLEMAQRLLKEQKQQSQKDKGKPEDKKEGDKKNEGEKERGSEGEKKQQQQQPGEMSKEDAERLLQAVEDQEREARRQALAQPPAGETVKEDW
jgi:Ca-activated chloride channel family protein